MRRFPFKSRCKQGHRQLPQGKGRKCADTTTLAKVSIRRTQAHQPMLSLAFEEKGRSCGPIPRPSHSWCSLGAGSADFYKKSSFRYQAVIPSSSMHQAYLCSFTRLLLLLTKTVDGNIKQTTFSLPLKHIYLFVCLRGYILLLKP